MVNIMVKALVTGLVAVMHPFFVSVVEINHNQQEKTVELSVRIFAEDLEKTLQKYSPAKVDILAPADKAMLDKQIAIYLREKLKLKVNGQSIALNYIGHEIQKESIWCYLEAPKVNDMSKLEVDCGLLYDFEKSQTNILHVKSKGVEKSSKLDYPNSFATFQF